MFVGVFLFVNFGYLSQGIFGLVHLIVGHIPVDRFWDESGRRNIRVLNTENEGSV